MEIERSVVDNLGVLKVFRLGEYDLRRKFPRPICVQLTDKSQKEVMLNSAKMLKSNRSAIRVVHQLPKEMREKRKQLFEIQKKYSERQIETKVKGDKLVFTQSNSVYRDKVDSRRIGDEVITPYEVNVSISSGKSIKDNRNRFLAHSTSVDSFKSVRKSLLEVMRLDSIPSASHNIYAYRFTSNDGITRWSDDDGEHGTGRALLVTQKYNEIEISLVVV
ncbi:protein IMPACT homolog [Ostrea edulis]|uniref:protein IMPACT homolog n=1 Tax=Ostrea edulis TaxID=37623 RepID=UPI0024AEA767|nr:protein IMPACT homolog [Ostrea edulis]